MKKLNVVQPWMIVLLVVCFGVVGLPCNADAAGNPWQSARVGDWCRYETITKNKEGSSPVTISTRTVVAVDKKFVTLKVETKIGKETLPVSESKIPLAKAPKSGRKGPKVENLGEGKETVKAGKVSFGCNWIKRKTTVKMSNGSSVSNTKVWTSVDAPLDGVVKVHSVSVTKFNEREIKNESTMALVAFGRGK